jgi:hypothetical protein
MSPDFDLYYSLVLLQVCTLFNTIRTNPSNPGNDIYIDESIHQFVQRIGTITLLYNRFCGCPNDRMEEATINPRAKMKPLARL